MDIYIYNLCTEWLYKLYEEYIINLKNYLEENFEVKIHIHIVDENIEISELQYNLGPNKNKKIIFCGNVHTVNKILLKYEYNEFYYLNIEQMSHESYYKLVRTLYPNIKIIDYSEENIPFFHNIYKKIYLLPPIFKETNNLKKEIDIISFSNNEYRNNILEEVKNDFNIQSLDNIFGNERDNIFKKSKIYINIHSSEKHKTMELIRIINLLRNKVIVLSQNSIYKDLLYVKNSIIIFNDIEQLKFLLNDILNNYNYYYQMVFKESNVIYYDNYIYQHVNRFIKN